MTKAEWYRLAGELQARWPNKTIPEASVELWFEDLDGLAAEEVRAAILALYREGREWCPNGAQIARKLAELRRDDVDHGEAWKLVNRALLKHAPYDWPAFYSALPPAVAEAAKRYGFETQGGYLKSEEGTVRAQFREIYKGVCDEREKRDAYVGIPNAGLPRLQRGGLRQLGAKEVLSDSGSERE